jgi:stage V sporulation protein B
LKIGAISVVFLSIGQVETVVLQGVKKLHLPIVSLGVSSIVKLIFELVFIKDLGIYAVEISNVLFYVTLCFINTVFLIKNKIYFGTPKNILYILLVLLFVESIKIAYGILTNMFVFILLGVCFISTGVVYLYIYGLEREMMNKSKVNKINLDDTRKFQKV